MDEILARIALFSGSNSVIPSVQKSVKATEKLSARQITEDNHRSRRVNTESNGVGVLCFSKDRPFQFEQFLISSSSFIAVERRQIKVVVLYSPGKFDHLYKGVFARHPHVIPVEENTDEGFGEAFLKSINLIYEAVSPGGSICFCVDDLIFFDDINLSLLAAVLADEDEGCKMLGFHLKLHPGIWYTHAGGSICYPPVLIGHRYSASSDKTNITSECDIQSTVHGGVTHLEYEHSGCSGDWGYPMDLCAGLYRIEDIRYLVGQCIREYGMKSIANPNILEVSLNRAYSEIRNSSPPSASASSVSPPHLSELMSLLAREFSALPLPTLLPYYSRSGCLCKPCVAVVTVNRVQSTYDVPTYGTAGGDIYALNSLCGGVEVTQNPIGMDFKKYSTDLSVSVHVGALHLLQLEVGSVPHTHLIPLDVEVRGEGKSEGKEEGRSEGRSEGVKRDNFSGMNNGATNSTDGKSSGSGISEVQSASVFPSPCSVCVLIPVRNGEKYLSHCLTTLLTEPQGCLFEILLVDDGSSDRTCVIAEEFQKNVLLGTFTKNPGVTMRILTLEPIGLSAALDRGLQSTSSAYVARLDCDDACAEGRLEKQKAFLDRYRDVHVVGGQAVVIHEHTDCTALATSDGNNNSNSNNKSSTNNNNNTGGGNDCSPHYTNQECGVLAAHYPTHPFLVHWGMFFKCCVLHPTAMFRRDIILQCGGYTNFNRTENDPSGVSGMIEGEDMMCVEDVVEDYSLWGRILTRYPRSIANIPDVVLQLRKHTQSKSATQKKVIICASDEVRWRLVSYALSEHTDVQNTQQNIQRCRLEMTKKSMDLLVHPVTQIKSGRDVHQAMEMLAVLMKYYMSIRSYPLSSRRYENREETTLSSMHADTVPLDESDGGVGVGAGAGDQDEMLSQVLVDSMQRRGKKVWQALLSHKAKCSTDQTKNDKIDKAHENHSDVPDLGSVLWEDLFSKYDVEHFKTLTAADIISKLTSPSMG